VLTGLVELPWKVNFGASVQGREGYPAPYWVRRAVDGINKNVLVDDVDAKRFENIFNVDLRASREFKFANDLGLTFSVDLFNATNERPVLQRTLRLNRTNSNDITEIQSPRIWRVGARLTF
jgi:hypothetical protein